MDTSDSREVVVVANQSLTDITDDIIASAERRIASVEKIISLALKITNEQDWIDQQGKPYLTGSGAEKIARLFGVCWGNVKTDKVITEDENGKFYFYQTSAIFSMRNDKVEAVGTCSSKDAFFAVRNGILQPLSKVDETNIMKASYTNCIANGITRLLGLRNLTWDQVSKSGLNKEKVSSIKYAEGGAGGGKISEAQAKRLFMITIEGSDTLEERSSREANLKKFLKENYHIERSQEINRKDYEAICDWAQAEAKKRTVGA